MKPNAPFAAAELVELDDRLLEKALAVVPMVEVAHGKTHPAVVGMRHDIDNEIESSVAFAKWEADRGYRSTYYVLHSAPYWQDKPLLRRSLEFIAECGHEIGLHNDALATAYTTGVDPRQILADALSELRDYGFTITGTVAHGNNLCYGPGGHVRFVNDQLFTDCPRPELEIPDGGMGRLKLKPAPLSAFDLQYDANWVARQEYLSDSGGQWSRPFDTVADGFPFSGQLHVLVHCCWWNEAFVTEEIAA